MPGAYLFGWDATNEVWVKCLVNAEGKLIIDPSEIFENTPTNDEHGKAPDSDWAYDHDAKADAHHAKYTDAEAQAAINADLDHGSTAPHNYFSGSHDDLIDVSAADHHAKYTDAEAQSLIDSHAADLDAHHAKYTDAEAQATINADSDHGSTAPHNYFSGSHDDLIDVSAADHHAKYTDAEALAAAEAGATSGDTAYKLMKRNAPGDVWCRLFRSSYSYTNADIAGIYTTRIIGGDYLRPSTPAQVADAIGLNSHAAISDAHHTKGGLPSGTKMLFKQNSAPSGWTFVSEDNDRVILNTGTEADGGAIGGTWQLPNVNGHAIIESEMPSHNHNISVSIGSAAANVQSYAASNAGYESCLTELVERDNPVWTTDHIRDTGHSHGASGSAGYTGSSLAHAHSQVNYWRPSYVKVITCQKD